MVGEVLEVIAAGEAVELDSAVVVDESVGGLGQSKHLIVVHERSCRNLLSEVELQQQFLLAPVH